MMEGQDAAESDTGPLPADDGRAANNNHSTACESSSREAKRGRPSVQEARVWLLKKLAIILKGWVTKEVIALSRLAIPIVRKN